MANQQGTFRVVRCIENPCGRRKRNATAKKGVQASRSELRCGETSSTLLFDAHRTGVYVYSLEQGLRLDPPREDGRRCLDTDEMKAKGWELNDRGRWLDPVRVQASREGFAKAA